MMNTTQININDKSRNKYDWNAYRNVQVPKISEINELADIFDISNVSFKNQYKK